MPTQIQSVVDWVTDLFTNRLDELLLRLLGIVILFLIGRSLAKWLSRIVESALQRYNLDATIVRFFSKAVYVLVLILLIVALLTLIGIPTGSIVAILGATTLAIGFALQDSLSNLAAGLILVFLKPFRIGDFVSIGGGPVDGTVRQIDFFHTELATTDNRTLLVPNREVMDNSIINYTNLAYRRIDLVFGIDYGDDLRVAKRIISDIVEADERILDDPKPRIVVGELGDSSVNILCQPYVRPADFLAVKFDLIEKVKLKFDEEGVTIPFPQRVLHVVVDGPEGTQIQLGTLNVDAA